MAWPPDRWEKPPGGWRDDISYGPEPYVPYGSAGPPAPTAALPEARQKPGHALFVRELLETIVLTGIIFVGIRLLVQNFRIEGRSMEPTLHSGQYLLVNKLSYFGPGDPDRGDIVVFQAWNQEKDFIKRVVGIPGDTVEIRDGCVRVNGSCLDEPYLDQPTSEGHSPVTLSQDEYFVMGDNRGNSSDSRQYGPLPGDRIIGKAWVTYWPPDDIGIVANSSSFASGEPGG